MCLILQDYGLYDLPVYFCPDPKVLQGYTKQAQFPAREENSVVIRANFGGEL